MGWLTVGDAASVAAVCACARQDSRKAARQRHLQVERTADMGQVVP